MKPHLIAIDGIDGAGKTWFAEKLREECSRRLLPAVLLRVDDFRQPVKWSGDGEVDASLYYERYYDFTRVDACLRAFESGAATIEVPVFDSVSEQIAGARTLELGGTRVLILEGVFTLRIPAIERATLLYLATSYAEARRRIAERDQKKKRSLAEVLRRVDQRYFPTQRRYHEEYAPRSRAHVVIDNENLSQPRTTTARVEDLPAELRAAVEALCPVG